MRIGMIVDTGLIVSLIALLGLAFWWGVIVGRNSMRGDQ